MQVDCRPDPEMSTTVIASLTGHFGADGAGRLWDAASPLLSEDSPSLVVDVTGVDLMASAGIGALVRLLHRVQSLGGRMAVIGTNERVGEVIEVVQLSRILNVCDTMGEARERLRS